MDQDNTKNTSSTDSVQDFDIKEFVKICLHKWWWFAICMAFAVGIALFYVYKKQPQYKRYEQILVNDQKAGGGVGDISKTFTNMGLFSKRTNVYNELLTITSPAIMYQVVDSLQLDMSYFRRDGLRLQTLYGSNLPFRVDLLDVENQGAGGFRMDLEPDGSMKLYKFYKSQHGKAEKFKEEMTVSPGTELIESPIGRIKISPNPRYVPGDSPTSETINIGKAPMQTAVEIYSAKLTGDLVDDDTDIIELSIEDESVERAVDILNYVLLVYNQNYIDDKNKMAISTSAFIDDRLKVIQRELGEVDESIASYIKRTGIPDAKASIESSLDINVKLEQELISKSNELSVAKYMKEFLSANNNIETVLPVNLGVGGTGLSSQILSYNELLLTRDNVLKSSSATNPLVLNYDSQLRSMRTAIQRSIDNEVNVLQVSVDKLQGEINKNRASLAATPENSLPLLAEGRQQAVKEALYLFLLQKREENELTQKFSADNVRVITPPIGPLNPVSPRKGLMIIVGAILGFGIPLILIYFLESINTTVRNKKDLEILKIPFAGEIPQVGKKSNLKKLADKTPLKKKIAEKPPMMVVEAGKRDVVNEAFRVVRGNIDFMKGKNTGSQVIMLTSFNPGSGKSFVAYNLALSFCLKDKRVLIIDCDLRHGSSSMFVGMPSTGLTDYLRDATDDWKSLVKQSKDNKNLDVLPIGKIPPNPAELLEDGRLQTLVEEARNDYDLVLLDCPPVNIVVDTQLVAPLADRTLFVIRAGLLEKSALKELNEFYEEKKFNNMSVILNGTEALHSRYYTYGNYQNLN